MRTYLSPVLHNVRDTLQSVKVYRAMRSGVVGLIYLDVVALGKIAERRGQDIASKIVTTLRDNVSSFGEHLNVRIVATRAIGDDLFIYCRPPSEGVYGGAYNYLLHQGERLKQLLEDAVNRECITEDKITLHVGASVIVSSKHQNFNQLMYNAIKEATSSAKNMILQDDIRLVELRKILIDKSVSMHMQPIVSLHTAEIFGVEALMRPPVESGFASPLELIQSARNAGQMFELQHLGMESAFAGFTGTAPTRKLFVNIDSTVILDPRFRIDDILSRLELLGLVPNQIVFELTERDSVEDYQRFSPIISDFRRKGFGIAIDDAGTGYSSLQAIAEVVPDYIKVDKSLVRGIDKDLAKSVMLETLVDLARKMNCQIIAEGIETEQELKRVLELDVGYGQGFFLARPAPMIPSIPTRVKQVIVNGAQSGQRAVQTVTMADILQTATAFDLETPVEQVVRFFDEADAESGIVVIQDGRPVGLVMREKVYRSLATQFGMALFWKRSIQHIMDTNPLVVDIGASLEDVSNLAMTREQNNLYDLVIVTHDGKLSGVVTIQSILAKMTADKIAGAREANPLTGLPGNRRIDRELHLWVNEGYAFHIIYLDIDNFKWYNDTFGFRAGDLVIGFVAELLQSVITELDVGSTFVGHIGGDDFIIFTRTSFPERLCERVIQAFDAGIRAYYDAKTTEALASEGNLAVLDRSGNQVLIMGLSISIALLHCPDYIASRVSLLTVSQQAARWKAVAKQQPGSSYVTAAFEY